MIKHLPLILGLILISSPVWSFDLGGFGGDVGKTLETAKDIGESAQKVKEANDKANEDLTPENEYYIGRSVGANIVNQYKVWDNPKATLYLNALLKTVSRGTTNPDTFGGWHLLILDSDQINAFAAPGGLIFVTRGILRVCPNETALAAVLAHESAHIQFQHGLDAIKKDRKNMVLITLASETSKHVGSEDFKKLAGIFRESVTNQVRTLINSGYSRDFEKQADEGAVDIMKKVGYNPAGLILMLEEMKKRLSPGGVDFSKTHPEPEERLKTVRAKIGGTPAPIAENKAMQDRFKEAMKGI